MAKKATTKKKATAKKATARATARAAAGRKAVAKPSKAPKKKTAAAAKPSKKKTPVTKKKAPASRKPPRRAEPPAKKTSTAKERPAAKARARRRKGGRDKKSQKFRAILLDRYRALMQAYASSKGNSRDVASDGTEDYIDYAVSSYDRDFSLSLTEMERRRIRLVEEALKRVDRGEYGHCLQCGQEIPEKRLEAEPWARHCIRCQELEEQGLLQQRPFDPDYDEDEVLDEDDDSGADSEDEEEADESDDSGGEDLSDDAAGGDDDDSDEEVSL